MKKIEIPKISVVIPTHNRPDRVKNAIQSVVDQSFKDIEIIVVDDAGEKSAESVVRCINDDRIIYIRHKKNRGGGAARNTGIKKARAEYVAFLDDDDEWFPKKLEKQFDVFEKHKEDVGFVFCGIRLYYEGKDGYGDQKFEKPGLHDFYEDILSHRFRTYTPTLMIKKSILDKVSGFDDSFPSNQEWEMMIRISKEIKGYWLPEILVKVNFLAGEHIGGNLGRRIEGRKKLIDKHLEKLKKRPKILAMHYFQLGIFCRDNEQFCLARRYVFRAVKNNPKNVLYWKHFLVLLFGGWLYRIIKNFV